MTEKPSVWGQVRAWVQDEVPATMLEAYRRAGGSVFELVDRAKARREACIADGFDPWTRPPAVRAELLCAWNALVLQTLGDALLDTDYAADPATAGFVPPATAEQALVYYAAVEGWLDRAQQTHANPDYVLDVEVPASLPPWTAERQLPALLRALHAVGEHAAAAMATLPQAVSDPGRQKQLHAIRETFASARSKAASAQELHETGPTRDKRLRLEWYAREAMELFFHLGQLVADPALAGGDASAVPVAVPARRASAAEPGKKARLPRDLGFDPWILTDPSVRGELKLNPRACDAITRMWESDTDPARTRSLHTQIQVALELGDVALATDRFGVRVGHWFRCPWGPIYVVKRTCRIHGASMPLGQRFILEIGIPTRERHVFTRAIRCGNFRGAEELEIEDVG